jgi:signal transduction histidine kinase
MNIRVPAEPASGGGRGAGRDGSSWHYERFVMRAGTLFYARVGLLALVLLVLVVPSWSLMVGISLLPGLMWHVFAVFYSTAGFLLKDRGKTGRWFTFGTLILDLVAICYLIVASGALRSPIMPVQLIFTLFFAILFPRPSGIIPPLLLLPVIAHFDQMVYERGFVTQDVFILLFYSAMNLIIVYVVVYLGEREELQHREIVALTRELNELAVLEERDRISREMHDGLGALISSMVMQAEYLSTLPADGELKREIAELRGTAEEGIEELRRCVRMMRGDLDLRKALEDFCTAFSQRGRLEIEFSMPKTEAEVRPDQQLMLLRVLQEAVNNTLKHAGPCKVTVMVGLGERGLEMIIADNGRGFAWSGAVEGHYGLANMQERARKAGGECEIKSAPGLGTTVTLRIPPADASAVQ